MIVMYYNIPMTDKMDKTDVVSKSSYASGGSEVITVTGIPEITSSKKVFLKAVEVDGSRCVLVVPYDVMSEHELEQMSERVYFEDNENVEQVGESYTVKGAKEIINEEKEELEDGESLIIKKKKNK